MNSTKKMVEALTDIHKNDIKWHGYYCVVKMFHAPEKDFGEVMQLANEHLKSVFPDRECFTYIFYAQSNDFEGEFLFQAKRIREYIDQMEKRRLESK